MAKTKRRAKKPARIQKTATDRPEAPRLEVITRRVRQIVDAFVQEDSTGYNGQPRDVEQIQKIFGRPEECWRGCPTDPYVGTADNEDQLHRLALDLLHGPTTIAPSAGKDPGSLHISWRNFEIAFGMEWQEKWKIARFLFDLQHPDRKQDLLPKAGVIVIGPGGTAFHVALQFAWRMRARFELKAKYFEASDIELHTNSFEVARLLGPLALDQTVQVFLAGINVSRSENKHRTKVSILINPSHPFEKKPIDCLLIGCQSVDEDGNVYTWAAQKDHRETVQNYLESLQKNGRVILVCTRRKFEKGQGTDDAKLIIDHPVDKCFVVTNTEPPFKPKKFRDVYWVGMPVSKPKG